MNIVKFSDFNRDYYIRSDLVEYIEVTEQTILINTKSGDRLFVDYDKSALQKLLDDMETLKND